MAYHARKPIELLEFDPTWVEEEQILSALRNPRHSDAAIDRTLFPEVIRNNRALLPRAYAQGFRYLVVRDPSQAYTVLKHSPFAEHLTQRFAEPTLHVFRIAPTAHALRNNPDNLGIEGYTGIKKPDATYFEEIRTRYSEWRVGWWREVLQNSVDACIEARKIYGRRGKIYCEIRHKANGDVIASVKDNGVGMNIKTLSSAFLTLGGTEKRAGAKAVGGLGKAKELLFHSWPKWTVHTRTDEMDPDQGIFVRGKYSPNHFPPCVKMPDGTYQANQGQVQEECKLSWIGSRKKSAPGTQVVVWMNEKEQVNKQDLLKFVNLSHLPGISIFFREIWEGDSGWTTADGDPITDNDAHWEKLEARNKAAKTPVILLRRKDGTGSDWDYTHEDGSPWGAIYHSPRAKEFTTPKIIVRANGLYMFTPGETNESKYAMSTEAIKGKVIIELIYKPKGHIWDSENQVWVKSDDIEDQDFKSYGPLELLGESRDNLRGDYMKALNTFLEELRERPKQILKRRRPPRIIRTRNRKTVQKDWDSLLEDVDVQSIPDTTALQDTLKTIKQNQQQHIIKKVQEAVEEDLDIFLDAEDEVPQWKQDQVMEVIKDSLTDNEIAVLQEMIQSGSPFVGGWQSITEEVKKIETAVDTSADWELWNNDILPQVVKDAKEMIAALPLSEWQKEAKEQEFTENMVKWLNWEPDFILHDEAGTEFYDSADDDAEDPNRDEYGHYIQKAPDHYRPELFRKREKKIAKLWVECIRLAFILIGRGAALIDPDKLSLPLQAGFFFENPPKGEDPDPEAIGMYRTHTGEGDSYRALLLSPAYLHVDSKGNRWKHRYNVSSNRDFAQFIAVVFHEVAHALRNIASLTSEWNKKPSRSHDDDFATILTHEGVKLAFIYSNLFNKLRAQKVDADTGGSVKSAKKQKVIQGQGYYKVIKPVGKGANPEFATLAEAMAYVDEKFSTYNGVEISALFWPNKGGGKRKDRTSYSTSVGSLRYPDNYQNYKTGFVKEGEGLEVIHQIWDDHWAPHWGEDWSSLAGSSLSEESYSEPHDGQAIWKRRLRRKRRSRRRGR